MPRIKGLDKWKNLCYINHRTKLLQGRWGEYDMSFYQCTKCGRITQDDVEPKLIDEIYERRYCSCGNDLALYLCDNIDDVYAWVDPFLDHRYFTY